MVSIRRLGTVGTAAVLAAVLVTSCAAQGPPAAGSPAGADASAGHSAGAGTGRAAGRLVIVGGPAPGTARPLSGVVTLDGAVHVRVAVGAGGRYRVRLPVGVYQVEGRSPQFGSGGYPCRAASAVTVVADGLSTANVVCRAR